MALIIGRFRKWLEFAKNDRGARSVQSQILKERHEIFISVRFVGLTLLSTVG